ncbi:hypothetical protein BC332_27913 [Capsicum chinense]|nr:hypothetical protein BC332_27913 [Capsicum chinense]
MPATFYYKHGLTNGSSSASPHEEANNQDHAGENSDRSALFPAIDHDNSINILIYCSRSEYGTIASLNHNFRSLIRSGELYTARRQIGVVEHWVYFSCQQPEWEAFDHVRLHGMLLPTMTPSDCFVQFSDKESIGIASPAVAVVNNRFYAVDYAEKPVRKYEKHNKAWVTWVTLAKMPTNNQYCKPLFLS